MLEKINVQVFDIEVRVYKYIFEGFQILGFYFRGFKVVDLGVVEVFEIFKVLQKVLTCSYD